MTVYACFLQWWPNWWTKAISPIWRTSCCGSTSITTTKTLDCRVCVWIWALRISCFSIPVSMYIATIACRCVRLTNSKPHILLRTDAVHHFLLWCVHWCFSPQRLNYVMCKINFHFKIPFSQFIKEVRNGQKALLEFYILNRAITAAHPFMNVFIFRHAKAHRRLHFRWLLRHIRVRETLQDQFESLQHDKCKQFNVIH